MVMPRACSSSRLSRYLGGGGGGGGGRRGRTSPAACGSPVPIVTTHTLPPPPALPPPPCPHRPDPTIDKWRRVTAIHTQNPPPHPPPSTSARLPAAATTAMPCCARRHSDPAQTRTQLRLGASPELTHELGVDESVGADEVVRQGGLAVVHVRHDTQVADAVLEGRGRGTRVGRMCGVKG